MSAPALNTYINGQQTAVSGDNLNTFEQTCNTLTDLRSFIGITGLQVYLRGFTAIGDGGQGVFYWNATSLGPDNGTSIIVPNGVAAGAWIRLTSPATLNSSYQIPLTGFTITIPSYTNALILNPAGTLASGTVIMPLNALDGQELLLTTSQTISTLTVTANTAQTLITAPTTLTAIAPFKWVYKLSTLTWYKA